MRIAPNPALPALFALPLLVMGCGNDSRNTIGEVDDSSGGLTTSTGAGDTDTGTDTTDGSGPETFDVGDGAATDGGGDDIEGCHAVDLLFVIDSSGSMEDEQDNLIGSFPGFITGIKDKLKYQSYHVGVLSTDAYEGNPPECQKLGALVTATTGENSSESTCGPFALDTAYMTSSDDLATAFECTARLGTVGSGDEQPMEAIAAAMDPAANGLEACNGDFLRDDALLVIVIVTDEEDDHEGQACANNPFSVNGGSAGEPPDWYDSVVAAKGGNANKVVTLSLVGPPGPDPKICPTLDKCGDAKLGAEMANRITQFTEMFNWGFVGRVCDPDYSDFFNAAIDNIVEACDEFPPEG